MELSIAEKRRKEVHRLAKMKSEDLTVENIVEAEKIMNSYYRLVHLCERNLLLSNCEATCNRRSTKESEEREEKWYKRLDKQFRETYGLQLTYFGYYPTICYQSDKGGLAQAISVYFY